MTMTVREYEQILQKEPAHSEAFLALRKAYRETGKLDRLVTLYECRAQAIDDPPKAAELFYLAAEVRLDHLGDPGGAEADLAHAVDKDPGHLKATKRLKDIYREQGRTADYMTMLEMEAVAVSRSPDPARIGELSAEMAQLSTHTLAKIERALGNPARKGDVTAEHLKLVESARKIYRALGDYGTVVRLYDLELQATTDAKRRCELLLGVGRVLAEKVGDLEGAAQRIGEVVRLRPRDDKALEALAGVYAHPSWIGADGAERAAALFHQVARRRHEAGDTDAALAALRKGLAAVPGHGEVSELLERVLYEAERLPDLDRYYRERVAGARSVEEKMDFLFKRAQLAEGDLGDAAEALRVYEEIVAIEPPGGPASQHLAELYQASQDYAKLAELREKQLEGAADPAFRLGLLTELASLYRDRLGDSEQAAVYLHAILQVDPANPEALQAYAEHFRQRGDWKELADLLEFAFDHAHRSGAPAEALLARLEEIAVIAEGKLGDAERALVAWQRMEEVSPGHEKAREAQKRLLLKSKQWDRMVALLEREAAAAQDPGQRTEILRRLARLFVDKLEAPDRAVAVYQQILAVDPRDAVALRALIESFERAERWPELAQLLREQVEGVPAKAEKVALLRRLLALHEERLNDQASASWAAAEILKLVPGDREAMGRLEAILERSEDKAHLVQTLEYHARYAATPEEKIQLTHRIADLLHNQLGEVEKAASYWEQLAKLAPAEPTALDALAAAYDKLNRPQDLARILEQQLERPGLDPATAAECLRRLAAVASGPLDDGERAQRAWEDLLRVMPTDREALEHLEDIYHVKGEWRALVGILERRIPLAEEPGMAVAFALERARVLEEELRNVDEAMRALDQIVTELDPRHLDAHDRLRRLAEARQDWPRVVNVAERRLFLTEDARERAERAFEIGMMWRDRLGDAAKAMAAFERVIELEPDNEQALRALAPLYAAAGDAERLVSTDERLLVRAEPPEERRRLMFELASTCQVALGEPRRAFEWYRRAYQEHPDDDTLGRLEAVAEAFDLWEDLVAVYAGERARSSDPGEQVEVAVKVASLCEKRLRSPGRAFTVLREALPADPAGERLLPELERLAAAIGEWKGLLDVYAQVARGRPAVEERVELLRRRAAVREDHLSDPVGALDEHLRSFALRPESLETRADILRLAEVTGRWEDALSVLAQLYARASSTEEKVAVACRAAALVETRVEDRVRAFRAYLNAFRLAPDNETIVAHLWRLAALIDHYEEPTSPSINIGTGPLALAVAQPEARSDQDEEDEGDEDIEEIDEVEELEADDEAEEPAPPPPPARRITFATPWEELAHAYEQLPAADSATRLRHLKHTAEVWETGAHDGGRALAVLERAFHLDLSDQAVRASLARLAAARGEAGWDEVCAIYLRVLEVAPREEAVALQHEVARFREQLGQTAAAEERYLEVLTLQPDDPTALDRLEQVYRGGERWAELAGILDKRLAVAGEPRGGATRARTLELADLYERQLERPYEAIDTLEKYVTTVEDDERGVDHPDVVREAVAGHEALVRLYTRVGLWQKTVTAVQRQIDLTADPGRVRDLRWRMAEIQERELGAGEGAVQTLEAILAAVPDDEEALAALDRLDSSHGRWEALQEVLRRRAELAKGPARTELIRRRARLLEDKLGNPDAAAACLRSLGAEALTDEEATAALLRNLRSAGLAHEALRVIAQRLELVSKQGGDVSRQVALHLELADLKSRQLGDPAGARHAIEAALALAPEDAVALSALARLFLEQNDFASYAEARLRQARSQPGTRAAVAALLEAGAVYRDQLANPAEARVCFERAVAEQPNDPEALHALASLVAAEGQLVEARGLYERQLELADSPGGKAAVLTDLARVLWDGGDTPAAIARLDEALELNPDHLPAVMTMADVYYKEQQWEQAERRLAQVVRRSRGQPEETARLYHRLAEVYDKLGRLDEGYRQLVEAERMVPGQLLIRMALGENRFKAHKWREVATHLEGVADHPDAARYPEEVAEALAHGAQAEIKLKRPERAVAMYEAALRLSPDHRPSLKALADLALERGGRREAAQYLRRVAQSSGDRAERVQLFAQLGDLYQALDDAAEARTAYQGAVAMIEHADEAHVPLLEKVLGLQRAAGARADAAETALRLAEAVSDRRDRAVRRREAAALLAELGEHARAAEVLERAVEDNPLDEQALVQIAEAYPRCGRGAELEALLDRVLPELPPVGDRPAARTRRADLWQRLGETRRERDPAAAITALERAVEAEPERVNARLLLTALYQGRPEHAEAAASNNRMLVLADITRSEPLRALAGAYAREGRTDRARCCYELLELLGGAEDDDRAFLLAHPAPVLKPEDPYAAALEEGDRARLLAHPEARVLSEVFAAMWEGVPGLAKVTLETLGVGAQDKISPLSELDIGKLYGQIGKALGNKRTNLYVNYDPAFSGVALIATPPPAVVVDDTLSDAPGAEVRFLLGRALELTRPEYILAATVPPREFAQLFASVLKAFHPRHARWRAGEKGAEQAAKLKKALPYKVAKRLAELFQEYDATPFSSARWRAMVHETGNRAGLLMCGDLAAAARIVAREQSPDTAAATIIELARAPGAVQGLLRYAISEEYFVLREALGTAIPRAVAA